MNKVKKKRAPRRDKGIPRSENSVLAQKIQRKNQLTLIQSGLKNKVKYQNLEMIIEKHCGVNAEKVIQALAKLACPTSEEEQQDKLSKHNGSIQIQLRAIELLMNYYYGKPSENTNTTIDKKVDVQVSQQVSSVVELVNENRSLLENMKVIEGGKNSNLNSIIDTELKEDKYEVLDDANSTSTG